MKLELGINTCFAVKRWPLAADWAAIVRERLGLNLIEHSFDLVSIGGSRGSTAIEQQAREVSSAAKDFDLEIRSTFTGLAAYSSNLLLSPEETVRAEAESWYRSAIDFSAAIGARATGGHVGAFSVGEWQDAGLKAERWVNLQTSLDRLSTYARNRGLRALMVENLAAAREPSTMEMIRDLLTDGDATCVPIRLALDLGHMCVPGTTGADRDPYAWIRSLGSKAFELQLQQSDHAGDHHWPFTAEANRRGRISAERVIEALGQSGVSEMPLILEIIPPFEQDDSSVLDDLAASVDYWLEALDKAGVSR